MLWMLYHRLCPGKVLWDGDALWSSTSGVILSSSEIALICSNSRKIVLFPGSQRSWADTCESLFHHIQLVYLENLSKLVSQKETLVCIYMLCCWALRVVQTLEISTIFNIFHLHFLAAWEGGWLISIWNIFGSRPVCFRSTIMHRDGLSACRSLKS